jgi:glycosyltransferase involved in cell wall biosynthesis
LIPRVAVVIPCFNDGQLTIEAVESIDENEPVEVVIVDDGSTETATLRALGQLEARGILVVRQENAGCSAARMTGVGATRAPYVFPLDGDNRLLPGSLAGLADALDETDAAFAYGDYRRVGEKSGVYRSPATFSPWAMTYGDFIPISSLIRRRDLLAVGGWSSIPMEDWDLWLKLANAGLTGTYVDRIVYEHRFLPNRMSADTRGNHRDYVNALRQRHRQLFASRRELRKAYPPTLFQRIAYPTVLGLRNAGRLPIWLESLLMRLWSP